MSGTQGSTAPAAGTKAQQNIVAANAALRAAFTRGSIFVKKTLPVATLNTAGITTIPLNNQGGLVGVDLEFSIVVKNSSAAVPANPNPGAPYSLIGNLNFVDQANVTRHSLSGQALYDYLCLRGGPRTGNPYDASFLLAEGGAGYPYVPDPVVPSSIGLSGSATYTFCLHLPISKSKDDTTGMVLLQTGNQNQPAVVNISLSPFLASAGTNNPFTQTVTITSGTVTPHQLYWQPQTGVTAPPVDTQVQWVLFETGQDSTNLTVGLLKQVLFQMQFKTYAVGVRYYNGSTFGTGGTDMTSVIEKTLGGTFYIDDDTPAMRFRRYRIRHGFDCAPGLYWFDYGRRPLQFDAVGIYEADFVPGTVNAGAYMTYLYDWLKIPSQLAQLPGGSQIG